MSREYTDLQMLRTLIDNTGNEGEGSAEQTVLDLVTWLYNRREEDAYTEVFDIIARNHSTNLWDFDSEERN